MPERRRKKRGIFNLFGFDEENSLFGQEAVKGGSGYSISVTYDSRGKPLVRVKTRGDVDETELRKDIEKKYPGAEIEGLEKKPLIKVVEEEKKKKEEKRKKKPKTKKKEKPHIRVVD